MIKRNFIIVLLLALLVAGATQTFASAQAVGTSIYLPLVLKNFFSYHLGWDITWHFDPGYGNPQDLLDDPLTRETFADFPYGVLPSTDWHLMEGDRTQVTVPAGAFVYIATGNVSVDGQALTLEYQDSNAYLIVIRGMSETSRDLTLSNYASGIYNIMPSGPYITLGWILDQVENVANPPNCGTGCGRATVIVVDLETNTYRVWQVSPSMPRNWQRQ